MRLLLLVASGLVLAASAQHSVPPSQSTAGLSLVLHLSDLHITAHDKRPNIERNEDLVIFTEALLPRLGVHAVVITGDLVDSKDLQGRGRQYEWEWQKYRNITDRMKHVAGLQCEVFLDMRGNHDTFDVPARAGADDFYARYGMQADSPMQRAFVRDLRPVDGCPSLQLLAVDGTPDPGWRSFLNFVAPFWKATLSEVHAALRDAQERRAASDGAPCPPPPLLAFGHQPLCVAEYPDQLRPPWGGPGGAHTLQDALAWHGAAAYLSGHLHDAFGTRLHGFHGLAAPAASAAAAGWGAAPGYAAGDRLLELETTDWKYQRRFRVVSVLDGVLSFTDAHFHVARPAPNCTDCAPRLLASHCADSPTELLHPDAGARAPPGAPLGAADVACAVQSEEGGAIAEPYWVHVISPPDARYHPSRRSETGRTFDRVVAALFWTHNLTLHLPPATPPPQSASHAPPARAPTSVYAHVACAGARGAPGAPAAHNWLRTVELAPETAPNAAAGTLPVYAGALDSQTLALARECQRASAANLTVQVFAALAGDGSSASAAGASCSAARPFFVDVGADTRPLDLGTSRVERFVVSTSFPVFVRALLAALMLTHLLLLVLTRVFRRPLLRFADRIQSRLTQPDETVGARIAARNVPSGGDAQERHAGPDAPSEAPLLAAKEPSSEPAERCDSVAQPVVPPLRASELACLLLRAALAPLFALARFACWREGWAAMLCYVAYYGLGPLAAARALGGAPPALVWAFGAVLPQPGAGGGWAMRWAPVAGTLQPAFLHYALVVAPGSLWVASVVGGWFVPRTHGPAARWLSRALLTAAAGFLLFSYCTLMRIAATVMGPVMVIVSPGYSWALPLTAVLMVWGAVASRRGRRLDSQDGREHKRK